MRENKRIIHILVIISIMFLSLISYLMYFNMFRAQEVASNSYNKRQWDDELYVKRGNIYDFKGRILAETVIDDNDVHTRVYPQGRLYSHIIGYHSKVYGKSLLEMQYDNQLLGKGDLSITFNGIREGFDLNLTIDNDMQRYAYEQMKGKKGAVVAMEPSTGKILAMVSLPDFDPEASDLEREWTSIVEREDAPLLPRATQGLYPPGSTYKIVTASAAYEEGKNNEEFDDNGEFTVGSLNVKNFNKEAHGKIDMKRGFEVSSNVVFCTLGYEMGAEKMLDISQRYGINKDLNFDIKTSKSQIQYGKMSNSDSALVAIGQGKLLVTPLQMAMITASIANDGVMMKPYFVGSVTTANGNTVSLTKPQELYTPISTGCAEYIKELMEGVVQNGTGTKARISGIKVAGKTGTAENEKDKAHSWFVGFAPADKPQIAVAVILENNGDTGGDTAAPIVKNIIAKYLKK